MLVQDVMQTTLITVGPETSLIEAARRVRERGIRHLLVVEHGMLVGIVSDRDLKRALPSDANLLSRGEVSYLLERVPVRDVMTRTVITIGATFPIEEAARLMVTEKISALPVTDDGRPVGIVTETDVLRIFARALGVGEPSSRLDVALPERAEALGELVRLVEEAGTTIASLVTLPGPRGARETILRIRTIDPRAAVHALEAKGYGVRTPWRG